VSTGRVQRGFACGKTSGHRPVVGQCPVSTLVSNALTIVTAMESVTLDSAGWLA